MMKNILGRKFGRLIAREPGGRSRSGNTLWKCSCACGGWAVVNVSNLLNEHTQSCGCLSVETTTKRSTHHGHALRSGHSTTYNSWWAMIQRCTDPSNNHWKSYGGANPSVTVCERWLDFKNFLADMGERPKGTTNGRFGDVGNYEPTNCRWMTEVEQQAEKRPSVQNGIAQHVRWHVNRGVIGSDCFFCEALHG